MKAGKNYLSDEVAFTTLKIDSLKEKSCMLYIDYWIGEGMIRSKMDALMYACGYFDGSGYYYKLSDEFLNELKNKDYGKSAEKERT